MKVNKKLAWVLGLALGVGMWSSTGPWIEAIPWPPYQQWCGRSIVQLLVVMLFVRSPLHFARLDRKEAAAGLCLGIGVLFYMHSIAAGGAVIGNTLYFSAPFAADAIRTWFLKEPLPVEYHSNLAVVALGFTIMHGTVVVGTPISAILWGALSACLLGLYAVIQQRLDDKLSERPMVFGFGAASISGLILCAWQGVDRASLTQEAVTAIVLGGILAGIAYLLLDRTMEQIPETLALLIMALEIPITPLWVWIFKGAAPPSNQIFGSLLVASAVARLSYKATRK